MILAGPTLDVSFQFQGGTGAIAGVPNRLVDVALLNVAIRIIKGAFRGLDRHMNAAGLQKVSGELPSWFLVRLDRGYFRYMLGGQGFCHGVLSLLFQVEC
jgi:hypothetical protein